MLLADNIVMLDKGKLIFSGVKEDFFQLNLSGYNIELPRIIELEKALGYPYMDEEEFFNGEGE